MIIMGKKVTLPLIPVVCVSAAMGIGYHYAQYNNLKTAPLDGDTPWMLIVVEEEFDRKTNIYKGDYVTFEECRKNAELYTNWELIPDPIVYVRAHCVYTLDYKAEMVMDFDEETPL